MITAHLADQAARIRSLELVAELVPRLGLDQAGSTQP